MGSLMARRGAPVLQACARLTSAGARDHSVARDGAAGRDVSNPGL